MAPVTPAALSPSYQVPIYIGSGNYGPSRYTIDVGLNGGSILPYNFDTGAPNMFTVVGATGGVPTASFTFAQNPTYHYFVAADGVTLGTAGGVAVVSAAATGNTANVAEVSQISVTSSGVTTTHDTTGAALQDGTYGDFGAGLYGSAGLGTILAQIPLPTGLNVGWMIDAAAPGATSGSLTIGLSPAMISAAGAMSGAIVMPLSPSGDMIPTASGGSVAGANKAQVADTVVTLSNGGVVRTGTLQTVFDTGGGPNAVIYDTNYFPADSGQLTLTYGSQTIVSYSGTTPYGGSVTVASATGTDRRINPGGAAIYDTYTVVFDVAGGSLILLPGDAAGAVLAAGAQSGTTSKGSAGDQPSSAGNVSIVTSGTSVSGMVLAAGIASADRQYVRNGGSAVGGQVLGQGAEFAIQDVRGIATGTQVLGGLQKVSAGGVVVSGFVAPNGGTWGEIDIFSGGVATGTVLSGAGGWNGRMAVSSGGQAVGTVVSYGSEGVAGEQGQVLVAGGGVIRAAFDQGIIEVASGGSAVATVVDAANSGWLIVQGGAFASGTVVRGSAGQHGTEDVFGTALATTLSGGVQVVHGGGVAINTQVGSGATLVNAGGTISAAHFAAGATSAVQGVTQSGAVVGHGLTLVAMSGAVLSDSVLQGGGQMIVSSGGVAHGTVVSVYSSETVLAGGSARQTQLGSGATLVNAGGSIAGTSFAAGAISAVLGITETGDAVAGGLTLQALSAGVLSAAPVLSGGVLAAASGGLVVGGLVSAGGRLTVAAGGTASGVVLASGALALTSGITTSLGVGGGVVLMAGAIDTASTIAVGGTETVQAGASASFAAVGGGIFVISGGAATNSEIHGVGTARLLAGALTSTQIGAGGQVAVLGGVASAIVVHDSATLVLGGGLASGIVVDSGATLVLAGGEAAAVTLNAGATEALRGATLSGLTIGTGVILQVLGGGVGQATTIDRGMAFVSAGGTLGGGTLLSGATLTLAQGGAVVGGLTLAGPADKLVLTRGATLGAVIADFSTGDVVDLLGIAYGGTTSASYSATAPGLGTLTVHGGYSQVQLTLSGSYTTSSFALAADGAGGTLVTLA